MNQVILQILSLGLTLARMYLTRAGITSPALDAAFTLNDRIKAGENITQEEADKAFDLGQKEIRGFLEPMEPTD